MADDLWEWFYDQEWEYEENDDWERLEMAQKHDEAYLQAESNPQAMVAIYKEGRDRAKQLEEPWWAFLYDVWMAIGYEHYVGDLQKGLTQALHCVNEARKPVLRDHPWRIAAYNTLLICYIKTDPLGYGEPIENCLQELAHEIPPGANDHRYVMLTHHREFLFSTGDYDLALQLAMEHLNLLEEEYSIWFDLLALIDVCRIGWYQRDWEKVDYFAEQAADIGKKHHNAKAYVTEAETWQAVACRKYGNEREAKRLFRSAESHRVNLENILSPQHYDALAYFHELGEDLESALEVRNEELQTVQGKGRVGYECDIHIKRCQLLSQLGRLSDEDLESARKATMPLKKPESYLERIEGLKKDG